MKVSEIKYERYSVEEYRQILREVISNIKTAKSIDEVLSAREKYIDASVKLETFSTLAYIRWTQHTKDEFYFNEKEYYDENIPSLQVDEIEYIKCIKSSKFLDELKNRLPETLFKIYDCKLKIMSDEITELLIEESKLENEYSKFMSELTIPFNGEELPLTVLKKYMSSDDRTVRIASYNAFGKILKENSEFLDDVFDKLVKVRDKLAKKLGLKNYVEYGYANMNRICYGEDDVKKFRNNILNEVVPICSKIRKAVASKMGIDEMKLYDYDVSFKSENPKPIKSGEELIEIGKKMYEDMSEETGEFINMMIDADAFDCISRKNKWGGGYQCDLPLYKQPFILANFNDTAADVDVLTHEAGHAFASYKMSKLNLDKEVGLPFMDIAETHSMSMEFFAWKYIDKFFGSNANKYKFKHLLESFTFLTYGIIVDAFQEICYKNPNMTAKERNDVWLDLEKKFRPYMNADGITYFEEGTRWQYQMHIFEEPFYYIDYCFAGVNSLQFLLLSLTNYDEAFERYIEFISGGSNFDFVTQTKKVGLKLPFEEGFLYDLSKNIEKLLNSLISDID